MSRKNRTKRKKKEEGIKRFFDSKILRNDKIIKF